MFDSENRVQVRHYLEQGVAKAEIARRLKIGRRTVYNWHAADGQLEKGACEGEYWPRGECGNGQQGPRSLPGRHTAHGE